jgi:molybdopterin-guanine dinucleotide biosynthesis protein A
MWAAIVLAGGRATRMGGVDKPALEVGGRTLLAAAVAAAAGADRVVVVGPERPLEADVVWTREAEPGTGPVAALAAGIDRLADFADDAVVVLLAADLPLVSADTVDRLRAAADVGAVLTDETGRDQWLLSAWRLGPLRAAMPQRPEGAALRRVLGGLDSARVAALGGEAADVDTPADLARYT